MKNNYPSKAKIFQAFLLIVFLTLIFFGTLSYVKNKGNIYLAKTTLLSNVKTNPNKILTTPDNYSPKKGDKYGPIKLPSPTGAYLKSHPLQSGPSYKVGSSCWSDKQIFSIPDSEKLAFACNTIQSGIDITGVTIPGIKMYRYCQLETGQILIYSVIPQNDISGSLQLVNPDGTIVGVAVLPTLPKQYNQEIQAIDPVVFTKNNQIYLFAATWGNRVANDSLKIDFNKGTTEILTPPTYINEGQCL